ncbi:TetR family transcriptional regulator [Alcanivorax xiamenensis]|uniref:TetR family transcriptional regulator n=1 Tax=Alcanivorax xiamenensis TaxID=1177156 RepID=A0ABQ6Y893_9GAMM|nr:MULTISPECIES: TetR/AcrR family transcriptional regulator [Alcanivorax]KAF0805494.1 TetR family transcriptional regulator [Alcanivorax xiamenensis]
MPSSDTRDKIVAAALATFVEKGVASATLQAIRERAEVSNGSLFHFFANKQSLCEAVYLEGIQDYQNGLAEQLKQSGGARESVAAVLRYHLEWTERNRDRARFLSERGYTGWGGDLARQVDQANTALMSTVSAWVRRHVAEGTLKPVSPEVVVATLLGPAQLLCRAWLASDSAAAPTSHLDELVAVTWRALSA